jgi:hypothetical protein
MVRINISLSFCSLISTFSALVSVSLFDKMSPTRKSWIIAAAKDVTITAAGKAHLATSFRRVRATYLRSAHLGTIF